MSVGEAPLTKRRITSQFAQGAPPDFGGNCRPWSTNQTWPRAAPPRSPRPCAMPWTFHADAVCDGSFWRTAACGLSSSTSIFHHPISTCRVSTQQRSQRGKHIVW